MCQNFLECLFQNFKYCIIGDMSWNSGKSIFTVTNTDYLQRKKYNKNEASESKRSKPFERLKWAQYEGKIENLAIKENVTITLQQPNKIIFKVNNFILR